MRNALVMALFPSSDRNRKKKLHGEKRGASWEAFSRSTDQKILYILWNRKACHRLHRNQPRVPILGHNESTSHCRPHLHSNQSHIIRKFRSSGMWHCGKGRVVPGVSQNRNALNFKVNQSKKNSNTVTRNSNLTKFIGVLLIPWLRFQNNYVGPSVLTKQNSCLSAYHFQFKMLQLHLSFQVTWYGFNV
jgi:hypothetical protein